MTMTQPEPTKAPRTLPDHVRVAILGAGFAGMGMAIRLRSAGMHDFVVCERDEEIGGTWYANTYPGCQCDVPSHLYSFSFFPNPSWTRTYAQQGELRDYLNRCADHFGIRDHIHLSTEITDAAWDEDAARWRVETTRGSFSADVLIAAPGGLSEPKIPDLPGLESFEGTIFHTARWNHDHELGGRRVAVVGTGASAIQAVPEIRAQAEHVDVYQRTPPWVVPHSDRPTTALERRIYRRLPALQRAVRLGVYWTREILVTGLVYQPKLMRLLERAARRHIENGVPDPELRARLTPDYTLGCKRILPSNRWYPALSERNVSVVDDGIAAIEADAIVTRTGERRPVDTIIFATGFQVADIPVARRIRGADGRTLRETWNGSAQAYRGTAIAGFPNLFLITGPNTGLGHTSMVFMIEAQINYLMDALRVMDERGVDRVEVREDAQREYNERVQSRLAGTVWSQGGCSSWYIDASGRNTTLWPGFTWRFWQDMRRFDAPAYELARSRAGELVSA